MKKYTDEENLQRRRERQHAYDLRNREKRRAYSKKRYAMTKAMKENYALHSKQLRKDEYLERCKKYTNKEVIDASAVVITEDIDINDYTYGIENFDDMLQKIYYQQEFKCGLNYDAN